jgi:hypothetical protein
MSATQRPVGAYRRAVRLKADDGWASAEMEDDVHHFKAVLRHDGERVTGVESAAPRTPWLTCSGAVGELERLRGLRLAEIRALPFAARAEHCLHLFDLALLAAAHAGERDFRRLYRIEVDHSDPARIAARMTCDGEEVLAWEIDDLRIRGSAFDGLSLAELPGRLADLAPDAREAALVLRRASMISFVRTLDLDAFPDTWTSNPDPRPSCYAKQPRRRAQGTRNYGASRDFWGTDAWPLADQAWPPTEG